MKNDRQKKIVELINQYDIETQEDLASRLIKEGFNVTQATVSRDIKELNLAKVQTKTGSKYAYGNNRDTTHKNKYVRILKDGFLSANRGENIIVIKSVPGMAMALAAAIDNLDFEEILGTIAGDDTIMCIAVNKKKAEDVIIKINEIIAQ